MPDYGRQIGPLVYPPPGRADLDAITEAENRRDAETKTAPVTARSSTGSKG